MPVDYAKHGAWLTKETFAGAGNRPAAVPQVGPTHPAAALSWGNSYTGKQLAAAPPLSFAVGDSATSFACMRSVAPAAASAGHTEPAEEASALAIPRAHLRVAGTASCSTIGERAAPAAATEARTRKGRGCAAARHRERPIHRGWGRGRLGRARVFPWTLRASTAASQHEPAATESVRAGSASERAAASLGEQPRCGAAGSNVPRGRSWPSAAAAC